jgi:hypothetical protein
LGKAARNPIPDVTGLSFPLVFLGSFIHVHRPSQNSTSCLTVPILLCALDVVYSSNLALASPRSSGIPSSRHVSHLRAPPTVAPPPTAVSRSPSCTPFANRPFPGSSFEGSFILNLIKHYTAAISPCYIYVLRAHRKTQPKSVSFG